MERELKPSQDQWRRTGEENIVVNVTQNKTAKGAIESQENNGQQSTNDLTGEFEIKNKDSDCAGEETEDPQISWTDRGPDWEVEKKMHPAQNLPGEIKQRDLPSANPQPYQLNNINSLQNQPINRSKN